MQVIVSWVLQCQALHSLPLSISPFLFPFSPAWALLPAEGQGQHMVLCQSPAPQGPCPTCRPSSLAVVPPAPAACSPCGH